MDALRHLLGHDPRIALLVPGVIMIAVVIYKMMRASTDLRFRAGDSIKPNPGGSLTVKRSAKESLVIRLNKDALEKSRELLRAGADIESVCREIEPAYANWRIVQQQAFRRAIEMMLKAEPTAQNSPQITSTKPG
jgi:hypothetical protein